MSVVLTATVHPAPGRLDEVLAAFARHVGTVHQEPGCELYALHVSGDDIVLIEKWAGEEQLQGHSQGAALSALNAELTGLLAGPADLVQLTPHPAGEPAKGAL